MKRPTFTDGYIPKGGPEPLKRTASGDIACDMADAGTAVQAISNKGNGMFGAPRRYECYFCEKHAQRASDEAWLVHPLGTSIYYDIKSLIFEEKGGDTE